MRYLRRIEEFQQLHVTILKDNMIHSVRTLEPHIAHSVLRYFVDHYSLEAVAT